MQPVEKNDVDISKLFYYGDKFDILDKAEKKVMTVYIRLVGDAELNQARVFALRSSADLRSKLKDKSSDERRAFIPENYDDLSNEDIINLIVLYSTQDITNDVIKNTEIPIPKEPKSDASLEEQEEYQRLVDAYPLYRVTKIREEVNLKIESLKETLSKKSKDELVVEYERVIIVTLCQQEMLTKFREMSTYFGCFKDKNYKTRLFSSFESFSNILPEIKQQLMDNYISLEVSNDELKK